MEIKINFGTISVFCAVFSIIFVLLESEEFRAIEDGD